MELAIMIEGQDGLNWQRWRRLAETAETRGFAGLFRSDHMTNPTGPFKDSLDLWTSLTWLASQTDRIEFGSIVSPVSFRNPVNTAWTAAAISDLSDGRFRLGLGGGWQEREHESFGFELGSKKERMDRFDEALQVITLLLRSEEPFDFSGHYYQMHDAFLLPRPSRNNHPPIVIGGNGERRTLPLVVKYADEWNGVFVLPDRYQELNDKIDALATKAGRDPGTIARTLMMRAVLGETEAKAEAKLDADALAGLRERGVPIGSPDQVTEVFQRYADAGCQRIMVQWIDMDDIAGLELLAREVMPAVR